MNGLGIKESKIFNLVFYFSHTKNRYIALSVISNFLFLFTIFLPSFLFLIFSTFPFSPSWLFHFLLSSSLFILSTFLVFPFLFLFSLSIILSCFHLFLPCSSCALLFLLYSPYFNPLPSPILYLYYSSFPILSTLLLFLVYSPIPHFLLFI